MGAKKIQFFELDPEEYQNEILLKIKELITEAVTELKPEPETIWLTRNQACEKLGVSLVTLYKWNKENILPAYKIGGSVRYKLEDIKAKISTKKKGV